MEIIIISGGGANLRALCDALERENVAIAAEPGPRVDDVLQRVSDLIDGMRTVKLSRPVMVPALDDRQHWKRNQARHTYRGRK